MQSECGLCLACVSLDRQKHMRRCHLREDRFYHSSGGPGNEQNWMEFMWPVYCKICAFLHALYLFIYIYVSVYLSLSISLLYFQSFKRIFLARKCEKNHGKVPNLSMFLFATLSVFNDIDWNGSRVPKPEEKDSKNQKERSRQEERKRTLLVPFPCTSCLRAG